MLISLIFCVMILTKPHDNHVFQRLSRTCSSQQEIIFANFQACIQAFMPGYRLFFTLLLGKRLGGMQKTNTKPNTEPYPNCCFSHDKGVLGSNSRDAFTLRILSYSVPKILRFLAFFHKTNEKPYSHEIHALTRKSRQSIIITLNSNLIRGFNSIIRATNLTEFHGLHACVHFSLSKPALQALIEIIQEIIYFSSKTSKTQKPQWFLGFLFHEKTPGTVQIGSAGHFIIVRNCPFTDSQYPLPHGRRWRKHGTGSG